MNRPFGKLLRKHRLLNDMSLRDLAERCGLSYSFIGSIEKGRFNASRDSVIQLANALHADVNEFLVTAGFVPEDGDAWKTIDDVAGSIDREIAEKMKKLGATVIELNEELLDRGMTKGELEQLLRMMVDLKTPGNKN